MRGRKPKPAALRILEGSPGKKRVEPTPPAGLPYPPADLDATARVAWLDVLESMGPTGAITLAEAPLLELYAKTYSDYRQAKAIVAEHGLGCGIAPDLHKFRDATIKFLIELGMTPAARQRLGVKPPTDPFSDRFIR